MRVFGLQLFPVIISIFLRINLDWSVNKNMKNADHFFFYAIDLWPNSSEIIRYPTSPYCKHTLVNISMQWHWLQTLVELYSFTILLRLTSCSSVVCVCRMVSISWQIKWWSNDQMIKKYKRTLFIIQSRSDNVSVTEYLMKLMVHLID